MIRIQVPKFHINDVKILITEEICISIDIRLIFDIPQTFENIRFFKFPKRKLIIILSIGHEKHPPNDT
jgi:hypothetical protein